MLDQILRGFHMSRRDMKKACSKATLLGGYGRVTCSLDFIFQQFGERLIQVSLIEFLLHLKDHEDWKKSALLKHIHCMGCCKICWQRKFMIQMSVCWKRKSIHKLFGYEPWDLGRCFISLMGSVWFWERGLGISRSPYRETIWSH